MAQNVAYYPINIVAGDDFSLVFTRNLKNCDTGTTTPVDLSSVNSVESKLLDNNNSVLLTITGSVTDAAAGQVTLSLTDTQTATLSGSVTTKPVETIGRYYVRLIYGDGTKTTILRGKASVTNVEGA